MRRSKMKELCIQWEKSPEDFCVLHSKLKTIFKKFAPVELDTSFGGKKTKTSLILRHGENIILDETIKEKIVSLGKVKKITIKEFTGKLRTTADQGDIPYIRPSKFLK